MTANQLRYWELRWKQHYENLYLKEMQRSNLAKEAETQRHNLASERIERQKLVIERIKLSQKQEEINQGWEKLAETQKANLMSWMFTQRELDQKERKLKAEIEDLLSKRAIAIAQFKVDAQHNMNQDFASFVNANANALKNGWGKGAAAIGVAAIEQLPGITSYDSILHDLEKDLGLVQSAKLSVVTNASEKEQEQLEKERKFNETRDELAVRMYGPDRAKAYKSMGYSQEARESVPKDFRNANTHPAAAIIWSGSSGERKASPSDAISTSTTENINPTKAGSFNGPGIQ